MIPSLLDHYTFSSDAKEAIINHDEIEVADIKIKNPNNPANLMDVKLIIT